ncbi:GntR family transcriptional regulator [Mesorhizobium sp. VK9D]|uniref:GntR family transcriptional regulator n=1 Tax=Mesorhizobium australafricanum TaxID=3072311 RepID=UPI002A23B817|nr:GntR family transcriptional regulator [Mesorhizobium sp. VK9D]MDX8452329.1 GntR family transcriptional regulator [Mesorhizobium sp. VK9D]
MDQLASHSKRGRGRPRNEFEDTGSADVFRRIARESRLDRSNAVPLWVQLKNAISDAILKKDLVPSARLPSEQTLCEIFEISRPVVRAAIAGLAAEGHLARVPRKGIFVSVPRMETNFLTSNVSVHSDLTARGHNVTSKAFEFRRCEPDDAERQVFGIPDGGTVVRIGRIYYSDGKAITNTLISLPGHRVPGFENLDIEGQSIFQILKEKYGLVSKRAERWFCAAMPDAKVAQMMGIQMSVPLISIESIAYDPDDVPLEYYRAYYNSAVARIHVSTTGVNN